MTAKKPWSEVVTNSAGKKSAEILLYDEIDPMGYWGISAKQFATALKDLDVEDLTVRVNSPGGSVYDGIAIMNALRSHKATVNTVVEGLAASAASFIAVGASDSLVMSKNSELMIHDARAFARGTAADFRKAADDLDRVSDNIASVYADKAGGKTADWRAVMEAETWYSASEAVDAGLADSVSGDTGGDAKNRFDLSIYNFAGRVHAPAPRIIPEASRDRVEEPENKEDATMALIDTLRDKLGLDAAADEAAVLAAFESATSRPDAPAIPAGAVIVDAAALNELKAQAKRGEDARKVQEAVERAAVVDSAVREGKIAPAAKASWVAQLEANPALESVINGLPVVFPVGESVGHSQDVATNESDDLYAAIFKEGL